MKGAAAGAVATAAMSGVMLARQRAGKMGRLPPKIITKRAIARLAGRPAREPTLTALSIASHFAFGAAGGGALALLAPPKNAALTVPLAVGFGTLIWAVSYAGWVPALGIMAPPRTDRPGRPSSMLLAHWVYGGVLGALLTRDCFRSTQG